MTTVHVDLRTPEGNGTSGYLNIRTAVRQHHDGAPDHITLTAPAFRVELSNGTATLDLDPTATGQAWVITECVPGGVTRYVDVPDQADIDYGDLVDIDPLTLDPYAPGSIAAWDELQRQVDALKRSLTYRADYQYSTNEAAYYGAVIGTPGQLEFWDIDTTGTDWSGLFARIVEGTIIYAQAKSDAKIWRRWKATGTATENATSWTIPVQVDADGTQGINPPPSTALAFSFSV